MRWLLLLSTLTACSRPLDVPSTQVDCQEIFDEQSCVAAGCELGPTCGCPGETPSCIPKGSFEAAPSCPTGCGELTACSDLTSAETCNARPDCWALLTFDELCNSAGCESHFVSCQSGYAVCDGSDCKALGGSCLGTNTSVWLNDASCAIGCVDVSKCPAP